jgi:23S rRNA (cytidine1920-2'-O)/16S rRNA (cytidine1409-2'-O)-methyltransferase
MRRRLDAELVRRGLCTSREAAQRAIRESQVLVGGSIADKASRMVGPGEPVRLVGPRPRYVSRGGEKLHGALAHFGIDPSGLWAFDAGASTGGFTDCLLQRGAVGVVAADVGFGQLHEKIRADSRVEVHEHVNLRTVDVPSFFGGRRFPLIVGDLSFISLRSLVPNLMALSAPDAILVLLVKPQFEAGRAEVAKGKGVIREPAVWLRALEAVMETFLSQGAVMMGAMTSPITGTDGNVEFLVHLRAGAPGAVDGAPAGSGVSLLSERDREMLAEVVAQAAVREGIDTTVANEPDVGSIGSLEQSGVLRAVGSADASESEVLHGESLAVPQIAGQIFGVIPHLARQQATIFSRELIAEIEALGGTVRVPATYASRVGLDAWAHDDATFADGLTLAFSMGGDGTMLHTVDMVARFSVPVLGVNVGHLGYLTALQPNELPALLHDVLAGRYVVEERMLLDITVEHPGLLVDAVEETSSIGAPQRGVDGSDLVSATGNASGPFIALNDAVLEKSSAGNTVRLAVAFNDEQFMDYSADGLIIATPTGSTAYAFSARGPIVSPRMDALVIVPVSPHMLFDRSLVLHGDESVRATVQEGRTATLFVDGRYAGQLAEGASVLIRRSPYRARLVTLFDRKFHSILKRKFGLSSTTLDDGLNPVDPVDPSFVPSAGAAALATVKAGLGLPGRLGTLDAD